MPVVDEFHYELGHIIHEVRLRDDITLDELASKAGVSAEYIRRLETGHNVMPIKIRTVEQIATALGIRLYLTFMDVEDWELWVESEEEQRRKSHRSLSGWNLWGCRSREPLPRTKKRKRRRKKRRKEMREE